MWKIITDDKQMYWSDRVYFSAQFVRVEISDRRAFLFKWCNIKSLEQLESEV